MQQLLFSPALENTNTRLGGGRGLPRGMKGVGAGPKLQELFDFEAPFMALIFSVYPMTRHSLGVHFKEAYCSWSVRLLLLSVNGKYSCFRYIFVLWEPSVHHLCTVLYRTNWKDVCRTSSSMMPHQPRIRFHKQKWRWYIFSGNMENVKYRSSPATNCWQTDVETSSIHKPVLFLLSDQEKCVKNTKACFWEEEKKQWHLRK